MNKMPPINNAIIAAAGEGSRLNLGMPKCLVKVNNRTIISYLLELLKDIPTVSICVGFMGDLVINEVKKYRKDIIIVRNPKYLETSSGYSFALAGKNLFGGALFFDADTIFDPNSFYKFYFVQI